MGSYIPATEEQKQKMLEAMGLSSTDELFSHIPSQVRLQGKLRIPEGLSGKWKIMREKTVFSGIFSGERALMIITYLPL